jgi:hypothetical protein
MLMGFNNLAEAVILQSIEDFWVPGQRLQSMDFFKGEGFNLYAKIAGLDTVNQMKILCLLGGERYDRSTGISGRKQ